MRELTARGIELRRILEGDALRVIEASPGGAQDVLGFSRKRQGLNKLKVGLEASGIKGIHAAVSHHELDAVPCVLAGKLLLAEKAIYYGPADDAIIMPKGENLGCKFRVSVAWAAPHTCVSSKYP